MGSEMSTMLYPGVIDMNQSALLNELGTALAKAQGEIQGAPKDSRNPFFNSSYADLKSVWEAIRIPFSKHGLSVIQTNKESSNVGTTVVVTTLLHSSGQWIRGELPITPVKGDPQALGSALTYGRRYALAAIAGVYQSDDDGEVATRGNHAAVQPDGGSRGLENGTAGSVTRWNSQVPVHPGKGTEAGGNGPSAGNTNQNGTGYIQGGKTEVRPPQAQNKAPQGKTEVPFTNPPAGFFTKLGV